MLYVIRTIYIYYYQGITRRLLCIRVYYTYVTGCDKTCHTGYFVKFELAILSITSILELTFCQV